MPQPSEGPTHDAIVEALRRLIEVTDAEDAEAQAQQEQREAA